MLRLSKDERELKENLLLASSTSFVSGAINVAGVVAFFAFTTNVTGHVANMAKHLAQQNIGELVVLLCWLAAFFAGAFISSFSIRSLRHRSNYYAHAVPIAIEIVVLLAVAVYGHNFYRETKTERELVIGAMLFSMGLQNNMVSTLSGGLIKSSHLTGLFTDLGGDVAELFHSRSSGNVTVKNRIYIRFTILGFYFLGGLVGGYLFDDFGFVIFYFIPIVLLTILYYDLSTVALHKLARIFWTPGKA